MNRTTKTLIWVASILAAIVLVGGGFATAHFAFGKKVAIAHTATPKPVPPVKRAAAPAKTPASPSITINNNVPAAPAPQVAAPAEPAQPAGWRNVNPGTAYFILANSNTSDAFAWNVANAVQSNGYGTWQVYSPVTGKYYAMTAYPVTGPDGGTAVMVTGGDNAAVELYVTTASGDEPPSMP